MYSLALIWGAYLVWYVFVIVLPNSFDSISNKTLNQQRISNDSKLRYIYINKKAYPQLKCVAIQAIIFFLLNVIYTIVSCVIFIILRNHLIITYFSIGYLHFL